MKVTEVLTRTRQFNDIVREKSLANNSDSTGLIMPNSFFVNVHKGEFNRGEMFGYSFYKELSVHRKFSTIAEYVWPLVRKSRKMLLYDILGYIAENIRYDSNLIRFSKEAISIATGSYVDSRQYLSALYTLSGFNILKFTDIQTVYAINPLAIYKGNMDKLLKLVYNHKFDLPVTDGSKICIDKVAFFKDNKDTDPTVYKNLKYYPKEIKEDHDSKTCLQN